MLTEPLLYDENTCFVQGGGQTSFPGSLSVMNEQVTQFWPVRCTGKSTGWGWKKKRKAILFLIKLEQTQQLLPFPFFLVKGEHNAWAQNSDLMSVLTKIYSCAKNA